MPDFAGAIAYALGRLQAELKPELVYHNLWHTRDEVMPGSVSLARALAVPQDDLRLLEVGAAFHDLGFVEIAAGHELAGVRLAADALPAYDFGIEQIDRIGGMILATRLPQNPHNLLEEILADADLDVLGRDDFEARNEALRQEFTALGRPAELPDWRRQQLGFLKQHRYFTSAARALREAGKARNIARFEALLAERSAP